ncbi:MAG: LysE family transporter [Candidatus Thermoplasmatota archaeon]|jgi:threonine/homoserine/homoserine lactone efflux protein|nr:LysE family transporter [Candidatus Thermoplasmatota archaeon]MED6337878.1 LysE family transporter [Candidatus Thermoplasmatota archaeon]
MEWEALATVLTLLTIGVVTPGPNNITCISHSAIHGAKSNKNLIFGMAIGFIIVHLIVGMLVENVEEGSTALQVLHYFGLLFIFAIALRVFTLNPALINKAVESNSLLSLTERTVTSVPILGFKTGLFMQFINGKEWAFVFAIMWLALEGFGGGWIGILSITAITTSGGLIAMILWTFVGGRLVDYVSEERRGRIVFRTLGSLLFLLGLAMAARGA